MLLELLFRPTDDASTSEPAGTDRARLRTWYVIVSESSGGRIRAHADNRHTSSHQASTRCLIASRICRHLSSLCSWVPPNAAGSSKLQCSLLEPPGKTGHLSALASSQTVIT